MRRSEKECSLQVFLASFPCKFSSYTRTQCTYEVSHRAALTVGDEIVVTDDAGGGAEAWYTGYLAADEAQSKGAFPGNFVQLKEHSAAAKPPLMRVSAAAQDPPVRTRACHTVQVQLCRVRVCAVSIDAGVRGSECLRCCRGGRPRLRAGSGDR